MMQQLSRRALLVSCSAAALLIGVSSALAFSHGNSFTGSGDLKSGAFAFWSVARAYNRAYANGSNPVIDLVDQAGANQITINILSSGRINVASINSWVAANSVTTIKVKKIYDQSGNGYHCSQATLANMPVLILQHPGLGNDTNLPTMDFTRTAVMSLASGATGLSSAVGTFSIVGRWNTVPKGNITQGFIQASSFGVAGNSDGFLQLYAGSIGQPVGVGLPDSFNAFQCVFNGASSFAYMNGGAKTANVNVGASLLGSPFTFGKWNGAQSLQGSISEIRFDSSAWVEADCIAETNNQKAFYFNSPKYEGIVATRLRRRYSTDATNKFIMSRSAHFAADDITALKVGFIGQGVITASVEYPASTFTQLKWVGATSITIGSAFPQVFSDYASVTIPKGSLFWINEFKDVSAGGAVLYNTWQNSFLGEATAMSATSISDLTMTGGVTNSGSPSGVSCSPHGIIGVTALPSVLVVGDSVAFGSFDVEDSSASATGYNGAVGFIGRALTTAAVPFLNYAVSGTTINGNTSLNLLFGKCSYVLSEFSINDFQFSARTAAQVQTDLGTQAAWFGPVPKYYQTTNTPKSNSTDVWATLINQSQNSAFYETQHVAFNTALRGGTTGILRLTGFIDVAQNGAESSLNSNRWAFPGITPDGIHMTTLGHTNIANSGVMTPLTVR